MTALAKLDAMLGELTTSAMAEANTVSQLEAAHIMYALSNARGSIARLNDFRLQPELCLAAPH